MGSVVLLLLIMLTTLCYNWSAANRYLQTYPPYNETDPRTPLTFALLQSFGGDYNSSGAVAGVQVALDLINSDPELLPGYTLHYTLTDSQCNRTVGLNALFQQVLPNFSGTDDPVKISIMGAGCSVATEPTAEISHFFNLSHISCVSSSTELADRVRFKSYFQLLPTEADIAPAYFGVIRQYGWRHVALIVQNENLFTVTMDRLKVLLHEIDVTFSERLFESDEGIAGLGPEPFDPDARIVIIATYSTHARPLLCEAHNQGLRYPQYLLLTYAWYSDGWWEAQPDAENLTCSSDDRISVLPHSLALLHFDFLPHLNLSTTTGTGITRSEYLDREEDHLGVPSVMKLPRQYRKSLRNAGTYLEYAPYCYDATWTLAYALNLTIQDLEYNNTLSQLAWKAQGISSSEIFRLENFTYSNDVIMKAIFNYVAKTDFIGVTGPVSFGDLGIRAVNTLRVMQFRYLPDENGTQRLDWVEIAHVVSDGGESYKFKYLPGESDTAIWPNNLVPYDGVPNQAVVSVSVALTTIFSILATAGILFALVCITFNAVYRKRKLVRLSSPKLNYLIGIGAIILYIDIYFSVVPTTNPEAVAALCTLTPWLTAIGYALCYGTVGVKMWRVYYIFNNPTSQKKKALKDWMLAIAVGILVVSDIVILTIYTTAEGYHGNLVSVKVPNREKMEDTEGELVVITRYFVYVCDSTSRDAFLAVLYGYKGALQVVSLLLAFFTRKVKMKGLNDAKYILAAIYVSSVVLAVIIVSTYSLKDFVNAFAAVFCTGFFIGTTVILGLVFGPKMVGLYKDPHGELVQNKSELSTQQHVTTTLANSDVENLRKRVKDLEALVAKQQKSASSSQKLVSHAELSLQLQPELEND